jgi:hypothetical protein
VVERSAVNRLVVGSNPTSGATSHGARKFATSGLQAVACLNLLHPFDRARFAQIGSSSTFSEEKSGSGRLTPEPAQNGPNPLSALGSEADMVNAF